MDDFTPQKSPQQRIEDKLDRIAEYLHHMDRRDRMRTITGMIQWGISLIPMILFLVSIWYMYSTASGLVENLSPTNVQQYIQSLQDYFKK